MTSRRVLLIAWDAADWNVISPLSTSCGCADWCQIGAQIGATDHNLIGATDHNLTTQVAPPFTGGYSKGNVSL